MDQPTLWCVGDEKVKVIEALKEIGCCDTCILRYLGVKEPYIYRDTSAVSKILNQPITGTAAEENTIENESSKRLKTSPCTVCLGLLEVGLQKSALDQIVSEIKGSNIESLSFCPVLSVPIAILIRSYSVWNFLVQTFPTIYLLKKEYKPEGISLKSVWKWMSTNYLQDGVNPLSEWHNDGKLTVQIFPFYEGEDKECKPFYDHFTQGGKVRMKKGRLPVTRSSVEGFLQPLESELYSAQFLCPPEIPTHAVTINRVVCSHAPIYVAGRYCKYSRTLSQTPWMIDGVRKTEDSVEELISKLVLPFLGADDAKFSSSGREDVDVRMLGKGRPFVLEVLNPRRTIFTPDRMLQLQRSINERTNLISVRDVQIVSKKEVAVLRQSEEDKTKEYCALCYAPNHNITEEDCQKLNAVALPLELMQNTPVRVLHRRSLICRKRSILKMRAEPVKLPNHEHTLFKLYVTTQAGTYVKEFVHGDFGRTSPNVSELLGFTTDILALDVEAINCDWPPEIVIPEDESLAACTDNGKSTGAS